MSKRFASNHYGENKKARLNISVSEHHLPLSQNSNKENDFDNWGDDNDDEMLLQASQACEQAISCNTSTLPNYSMWDPPSSTSTQYQSPPSTSKAPFTFKKPSANIPTSISTHLKNKCSTISSPLPGMANKFVPDCNSFANLTDDLVINAKGMPGQDAYSQILRLKEEKEKLLADIDKLQQKCVTKEGEASILRTQLKSSQMAIDSVRMEKARIQEDVKKEFKSKLDAYESQMANLQTQLEFKNLEIISVKEKCKNLESGKRMTQVIVPSHDISSSYRNNFGITAACDSSHSRRAHTSSSAQTEYDMPFVKLKKTCRKDISNLSEILPLILEPTQQQHSILYYNENLQKPDCSQNWSKVVSPANRIPSAPGPAKVNNKGKVTVSSIVPDLAYLAELEEIREPNEKCYHLFSTLYEALNEVLQELQELSRRVSTAFLKEMDERYIEASLHFLDIDMNQLLKGRELYKDEQALCARRILAVVACVLEVRGGVDLFHRFEQTTATPIVDTAIRICELIDHCAGGVPYSGVAASLSAVLTQATRALPHAYAAAARRAARALAAARVAPGACARLLALLRGGGAGAALCGGADLRADHDQGLQLFHKDSCHLQVLLKQVETALRCMEKQGLQRQVTETVDDLTGLYHTLSGHFWINPEETRCGCQAMLVQGLIYSLRICTVMLEKNNGNADGEEGSKMLSSCRSCVRALYQWSLRAPPAAEGRLGDACDALRRLRPDSDLDNMLNELASTTQAAAEEAPASFLQEPWQMSFQNFTMAD